MASLPSLPSPLNIGSWNGKTESAITFAGKLIQPNLKFTKDRFLLIGALQHAPPAIEKSQSAKAGAKESTPIGIAERKGICVTVGHFEAALCKQVMKPLRPSAMGFLFAQSVDQM